MFNGNTCQYNYFFFCFNLHNYILPASRFLCHIVIWIITELFSYYYYGTHETWDVMSARFRTLTEVWKYKSWHRARHDDREMYNTFNVAVKYAFRRRPKHVCRANDKSTISFMTCIKSRYNAVRRARPWSR